MTLKKNCYVYDVSQKIDKVFCDNKVNKVIQIDNGPLNIYMGNFSINKWCNHIKNLVDLLVNTDAKLPGANLVAYTLNEFL